MTRKVLSVVIVGLGDIGFKYDLSSDQNIYIQTHSSSIFLNPCYELKAGVDINPYACKLFSNKYNVKSSTNLRDALVTYKPDLIILAVPTAEQHKIIRKISKYFIPKAILCEKPMGRDLPDGVQIVNTCAKYGIKLFVNYIRRCLPESLEVKDRIDRNIINSPMKAIVWYSKGISHNGSHFINLLEYWFGGCIDISIIDRGREYKNFGYEPLVNLKFKKCEAIMIPAWEELYSYYTIEIISSSGRLYWNNEKLIWNEAAKNNNSNNHRYLLEESEYIKTESNKYQMHVASQLYEAIIGNNSSICSGDEALQTLKTIDHILKVC
jgi:predicted dehydrogenase